MACDCRKLWTVDTKWCHLDMHDIREVSDKGDGHELIEYEDGEIELVHCTSYGVFEGDRIKCLICGDIEVVVDEE